MKYKVGQKVLLKNKKGRTWNNLGLMNCWKGKIVTIDKIVSEYSFTIKEDNFENSGCKWVFNVEDIEREIKYKVEDNIIEYKGKKYDVCEITNDYNCKGNKIFYLKLEEHKEEILDEAEKRYLRNVIKYVIEPTHNEVKFIRKTNILDGFFLIIRFDNDYDERLRLPYLNDKRMYKGMELDKEYTLEQLGLED